ncbi:MAG: hypothetical protein OEM02_01360 [Desulfobulbaceae bacterium]|nr:hypothetical protein [Desulfobulbaceae bacterium]
MNIIHSEDPDILESKNTKIFTPSRIFGVMSFFTFILIFSNSFEFLEKENIPAFIFVQVFGAIFAITGTILLFGQNGFILDRRRQKAVDWMGIFGFEKKEEYSLENYDAILIGKEPRSTTTGTRMFYTLMLKGKVDIENLGIYLYRDYEEALKYGDLLSKFLNMEIVNTTS